MPLLTYFQLFMAQTIVGATIVLSKYLLGVFPVLLLVSLRFVMAALLLTLIFSISREKINHNRYGQPLSLKDWGIIFCQAICAGFLFNILLIYGLKYTSATAAGIINSILPVMIIVLSWLLLKERLAINKIFAIVITVIGLIILSLGQESSGLGQRIFLGDILIFLAVIPEALFTIIAKWYGDHVKPLVMTMIVNGFNAILFLPLLLWSLSTFDYTQVTLWDWFLFLILMSTNILFYVFWYKGLAKSSVSTAALFTAFMPISAMLLAWLFLRENIYWFHYLGMACVIGAIVLGTRRRVTT